MSKPKLIIFASGDKDGGGSGFQELVENSRSGVLNAEIVGVASNHANGGVFKKAQAFGVKFIPMLTDFKAAHYQEILQTIGAEWIALSGWLKLVEGLDPRRTINIHPGPLPDFGGPGLYGHNVHEAVMKAYREGRIKKSAVSMHFVTEKYDEGPVFFQYPVLIRESDTPETLAARVNKIEHGWQSYITNLVVSGQISWNGNKNSPISVPRGYKFHLPIKLG